MTVNLFWIKVNFTTLGVSGLLHAEKLRFLNLPKLTFAKKRHLVGIFYAVKYGRILIWGKVSSTKV